MKNLTDQLSELQARLIRNASAQNSIPIIPQLKYIEDI